jgi:hypothetical protein
MREGKKSRRIDVRMILNNPKLRRKLMVQTIIATQALEGIVTIQEQAKERFREE